MTMPKSLRTVLLASGGFIGLLLLAAVLLLALVDTGAYKRRLEATATEALGMEVKVGGRLRLGLFPGVHVTLEDVHVRNRGKSLGSAKEVELGIALLPLFRNEIRIASISLARPTITVELDAEGKFNFERPGTTAGTFSSSDLASVSLSEGILRYVDKRSGEEFEAGSCRMGVSDLLLPDLSGTDRMKRLSFEAELACRKIQAKDFTLSELKVSGNSKHGVLNLRSVTMRVFGGQGAGSVRADFSGAAPAYRLRYTLSQFHIEEFLKVLSTQKLAEGAMDFSADLSMQGWSAGELKQSANGEASLRGENLTLNGHDLDREFSQFESSQNFSLVDTGAYFFAGPVGMVVAKGYHFAALLKGTGGVSAVRTFVSDWKIEGGVMQARDVAMATNKYRMALVGGLDLANGSFREVTMALLDAKGCVEVQQKISGTFEEPVIQKPSIIRSLAGPALSLLKKGKRLLAGCEVFYQGSVGPPGDATDHSALPASAPSP